MKIKSHAEKKGSCGRCLQALTETDGPVRYCKGPFKGKRTTPAFIPTIVKAISEIKNMNIEEVAAQITRNFEEFFKVKLNQVE